MALQHLIPPIYYTKVYHLLNRLLDPLNTPLKRPFSLWSGILGLFLSPWVVVFRFIFLFGLRLELGTLIAGVFS